MVLKYQDLRDEMARLDDEISEHKARGLRIPPKLKERRLAAGDKFVEAHRGWSLLTESQHESKSIT